MAVGFRKPVVIGGTPKDEKLRPCKESAVGRRMTRTPSRAAAGDRGHPILAGVVAPGSPFPPSDLLPAPLSSGPSWKPESEVVQGK